MRWFLPILSKKSWFQALPGHGKESRRGRNQEIQRLSCLKSLIWSKHPRIKFFVEEYVCINKKICAWLLDLALYLQSAAQMKHLNANCCHLSDVWRRSVPRSCPSDRESTLEMSPRVKKSPSSTFNLSYSNSSNERHWLNYFKMNRCPIKVRRIPPSLKWRLTASITCVNQMLPVAPHHLRRYINKDSPTWQK